MRQGFEPLNEDEYNRLRRSIALITVLIAGADGKIDQEEMDWAEKVQKIRSYNLPDKLANFYKDVGTDYAEVVESIINNYPEDTASRQSVLSGDLASINPILAKLDNEMAFEIYRSLLSFAKHVGKATGGFFGFGSIGAKESTWVSLPMLDEIHLIE